MICVEVSRSNLKYSCSTMTTNSIGVKSSLSSTTWYMRGALVRRGLAFGHDGALARVGKTRLGRQRAAAVEAFSSGMN